MKAERRRPRVVHDRDDAARTARARDGGYVNHFERQRTGRLEIDDPRIRLKQRLDARTDVRIEIRDFDAELAQRLLAECASGTIQTVDDQKVIATAQIGEQRRRDRTQSARRDDGAIAALEFCDRVLESTRRRRSFATICKALVSAARAIPAGLQQLLDTVEDEGR